MPRCGTAVVRLRPPPLGFLESENKRESTMNRHLPQGSFPDVLGTEDGMAGDCRGLNFFDIDPGLQDLLQLNLDPQLLEASHASLRRLGALAGGRLDELAAAADQNPPRLHTRDRAGRDEDWIETHPAYRELEHYAYGDFGIHAIGRQAGLLGLPGVAPPLLRYVCQYLFVQAEFGLICPVAMTDSCAHVIATHGSDELKLRYLEGLTSTDPRRLLKGAQLMTERQAGSDVGAVQTRAVRTADGWSIHGEKWFCSAADADLLLMLARSDPDSHGTRGLSLFAVPRRLPDGTRNRFSIRRLKDKLGTRSMPTGEIQFEGAHALLVGAEGSGLKIVLEQVNMSRLSHGVRAAAMMRRCLNESLVVAHSRRAFGRRLVDMPMVQPQLLQLRMAAEQALSVAFAVLRWLPVASDGNADAAGRVRMLTPLIKLGACRDNVEIATAAMELRGGNGFIKDYVNERLVRDAQTGLLWEGTSNIVAIDLVVRAVGRKRAHQPLIGWLLQELDDATRCWPSLRLLPHLHQRIHALGDDLQQLAQQDEPIGAVSLGMRAYHTISAVLLAIEGCQLLRQRGDGLRLLYAHSVVKQRLAARDAAGRASMHAAAVRAALLGERVNAGELEAWGV